MSGALGSGHGEKLTRKQESAVAALLACPTLEEAARQVGIGQATLRRWLAIPAFAAAFRAARRRVVEAAIARLQQATTDAVAALQRNLTSGTPSVEVQAARVILEQATRAIERMDLLERADKLEQAMSHDGLG